MTSNEAKQDLNRQAEICQSSLEVVLSSLGFHIPTTIDYVLAMYLAVSFHGSLTIRYFSSLTECIL